MRALVRTRRDGSAAAGPAASSGEADSDSGASGSGEAEAFPQSVEIVYGDLGDYQACRAAVEGVDKVGAGGPGGWVEVGDRATRLRGT